MWQLVVVLIVVGLALVILVRRLYRTIKGKEDLCSCGSRTCGGDPTGGFPGCRKADNKSLSAASDEPKFPMARS